MSKIFHISDSHMSMNYFNKIKSSSDDFIFHTGDFCRINFTSFNVNQLTFDQALVFLDVFSKIKGKKFLCSGNHETFLNNPEMRLQFESKCRELNIVFLDDFSKIIIVDGLKICGAGYYSTIMKMMTSKHSFYEGDHSWFSLIPKDEIDILVTHGPPKIMNSEFEFLSDDLRLFLNTRKNKIPMVLSGHVHEAHGVYKNNTEIVSITGPSKINIHNIISKD